MAKLSSTKHEGKRHAVVIHAAAARPLTWRSRSNEPDDNSFVRFGVWIDGEDRRYQLELNREEMERIVEHWTKAA